MSDHLDDTDPNLNEPIYANVNSKKQSSPVQLPDLFEYIRENKKNECEGFKKEFNVRWMQQKFLISLKYLEHFMFVNEG